MKNLSSVVLAGLVLSACNSTTTSQQTPSTTAPQVTFVDYQRAEAFLPNNVRNKVRNLAVVPKWIGETNNFWFNEQDKQGNNSYFLVQPESGKVSPLFDHAKIQEVLSHDSTKPFAVTINNVDLTAKQVTFTYNDKKLLCSTVENTCQEQEAEKSENTPWYTSPDGKYTASVKEWNLYLTNNETKEVTQLTTDGTEGYPYAVQNMNPRNFMDKEPGSVPEWLSIYWSKDSKTLITHRMNREKVGKLHLLQSVHDGGLRPRLYSYYYPLAGDEHTPEGDIISVDVASKKVTQVDAPKLLQTYYGGPIWGWWESNNKFYFYEQARAKKRMAFFEYSPEDHSVRKIVENTTDTFIDPWTQDVWVLPDSDELIWTSQKSGKQQYYLYELSTGKFKNKITQCDCFVRTNRGLDAENRVLYYEASGEFADRDPYLRHLYRVNLDGTDNRLLTPEPLEHSATISPDFKYFVDLASDAQTVPTSTVRSTEDGRVVTKVGNPDISDLTAEGWKPPTPFEVTANDGKTKLYGLMYKPSNFDETKKYPVIDATYTGPHNFFTRKSFWTYFEQAQALAELGFVVIKMDGRGTSKRDRDFHTVAYENLAAGVDDHVQAIKDLAKRHSYLDATRVGIYGFSAGGYDTAQAMFRHADFFKVGVSASGNHDFRTDKTGWNEIWLGFPVQPFWDEQSNLNMESVKKLKGKLLLAHGELDDNVNPAATLQLADKLIKANKDFDLMIYPNGDHVLNKNKYFIRKRWDYFVEHLLGAKLVKEYPIGEDPKSAY